MEHPLCHGVGTVKYEVVVIGGGTWGCSTAYHLARMKRSVAVIERGYVPYGQSGHTSAIIRQFYVNPATARMARMSLEFFRHFSEYTGYNAFFKQTGMLAISDDVGALRRTVDVMKSEGIKCKIIDKDEANLLEPSMTVASDEVVAYEPDAGFANPVATAVGFSRAAELLGARIYQGTEVLSIEAKSSSWSVRTNSGEFDCEKLVVAAGTNTPRLLSQLGMRLPVFFLPFPVCYFMRPEGTNSAQRVIFDTVNNYYSKPEGDQILLGAMHSEMSYGETHDFALPENMRWSSCDPDFTGRVSYDTASAYSAGLAARFPEMSSARICRDFMPYIDITPDWEPIIDNASSFGFPSLYLGCGSSGHGFKLSPMAGRLLAELVEYGESRSMDTSAYSLSRKALKNEQSEN